MYCNRKKTCLFIFLQGHGRVDEWMMEPLENICLHNQGNPIHLTEPEVTKRIGQDYRSELTIDTRMKSSLLSLMCLWRTQGVHMGVHRWILRQCTDRCRESWESQSGESCEQCAGINILSCAGINACCSNHLGSCQKTISAVGGGELP